jgi:hypothetical protein
MDQADVWTFVAELAGTAALVIIGVGAIADRYPMYGDFGATAVA